MLVRHHSRGGTSCQNHVYLLRGPRHAEEIWTAASDAPCANAGWHGPAPEALISPSPPPCSLTTHHSPQRAPRHVGRLDPTPNHTMER